MCLQETGRYCFVLCIYAATGIQPTTYETSTNPTPMIQATQHIAIVIIGIMSHFLKRAYIVEKSNTLFNAIIYLNGMTSSILETNVASITDVNNSTFHFHIHTNTVVHGMCKIQSLVINVANIHKRNNIFEYSLSPQLGRTQSRVKTDSIRPQNKVVLLLRL